MPHSPVKLLIVDDVPENLDALEALLGDDEVELLRACSGPEALEILLVHEVALALLDVQMPVMDGFELAELMRGTARTRSIPIIFLTAVATDERRRFRGYEAGAVDYLLKPLDSQILRSKVEIFCELARQRQELSSQRDELATALKRIRAHSDNSPLAIVEFSPELRIITWSKGAERLFGHTADEAIGRRLVDLGWLSEEDQSGFAELIGDMGQQNRLREMQPYRAHHKDGATLNCEWYCSALLNGAGSLVSVNVQILDVTERTRAEETQRLLVGELNHRVKNTLASVQAIATQTLRYSSIPEEFAPLFIGRIHALACAHSLLSGATWHGARLRDLIDAQLQLGTIDKARLNVSGPEINLAAEPALRLALVLHELSTNANKYGALSNATGKVDLSWHLQEGNLEIDWIESGGPRVKPPTRRGFGTSLIERSIKGETGVAHASYASEGVRWKLKMAHETTASAETPLQTVKAANPSTETRRMDISVVKPIQGKRFLVVEDEPLVALEVGSILRDAGAEVVGPAGTVEQALRIIEADALDGALLDGNLDGERVDGIADALSRSNIPFLFVSGYGREHLPAGFGGVNLLLKPFNTSGLLKAATQLLASQTVGDQAAGAVQKRSGLLKKGRVSRSRA